MSLKREGTGPASRDFALGALCRGRTYTDIALRNWLEVQICWSPSVVRMGTLPPACQVARRPLCGAVVLIAPAPEKGRPGVIMHSPQPWPLVKATRAPTAVTMSGHRQRTPAPLAGQAPVWATCARPPPAPGSWSSLTDAFAALCWPGGALPRSPPLLGAASPWLSLSGGVIPLGPPLGWAQPCAPTSYCERCKE